MALEGSLKEFGLADILQLIYFQRKTGILTLEGTMDKVRLLFYEGSIVAADSKRKSEANRLGKLLVKRGVIRDEELQKALEEQQSSGIKLVHILIKNGLIKKEQLQEIIASQITETVAQLFKWKEGFYEFSPQGVPVDKELPVSLDTQHILMEGLRIVDEWSLIEGKLTPDTIFDRTAKSIAGLTPDEEEVLKFVDGEGDVGTIVDKSLMDNFKASKALASLLEKGIIEIKEAAPVSPAAISTATPATAKETTPFIRFIGNAAISIIFLISFFIALLQLLQQKPDLSKVQASEDMDEIRFRIEAYKYEHGGYPQSIRLITKQNDRWGRQYFYKTENNGFVFFSAGPDGKEGTGDDIY